MSDGNSRKLTLTRYFYGDKFTLGYVVWTRQDGTDDIVYTIENPWLENEAGLSCIPDGSYVAYHGWYNRGGYPCIELLTDHLVPKRRDIKIHRGNVIDNQVRGCILVGDKIRTKDGEMSIFQSLQAWKRLFGDWKEKKFELEIRPLHPLPGTAGVQVMEAAS